MVVVVLPCFNAQADIFAVVNCCVVELIQGLIFIFGVLDYCKLRALLGGLRRLMSNKLALHVIATFTEQVVPIRKHITLF